ncbi:MAG: hypothetical protein AB1346_06325 [Thermodesulfobacteriota bacterium]
MTANEVTCPRCDVRIPADLAACPFCKQPVAPVPEKEEARDIRELLVPPETFPAWKRFYREYGKWLKAAIPVLIAVPVLWILFLLVTGLKVEIPEDPVFPMEVAHEKSGGRTVLLKGTLTNRGEDIPDLSLRSIGVTAEFRWSDGRVERKRVFPKSPFRGEGALFRGESGTFELEVPEGADAVTLRAGIVDLGEGRRFNLPRQKGLPPRRTGK